MYLKIIFYAFDLFGKFQVPNNIDKDDLTELNLFFKEAGNKSVSKVYLNKNLTKRGMNKNIKLIQGDIVKTLPNFLKKNNQKFFFINIDVDLYEVTFFILEIIWNKVSKGGIIWLDDYREKKGKSISRGYKGN